MVGPGEAEHWTPAPMDMMGVGELKSWVYPSLEHGPFKHLVKTTDLSQRKSRNMRTHTHTLFHTISRSLGIL